MNEESIQIKCSLCEKIITGKETCFAQGGEWKHYDCDRIARGITDRLAVYKESKESLDREINAFTYMPNPQSPIKPRPVVFTRTLKDVSWIDLATIKGTDTDLFGRPIHIKIDLARRIVLEINGKPVRLTYSAYNQSRVELAVVTEPPEEDQIRLSGAKIKWERDKDILNVNPPGDKGTVTPE